MQMDEWMSETSYYRCFIKFVHLLQLQAGFSPVLQVTQSPAFKQLFGYWQVEKVGEKEVVSTSQMANGALDDLAVTEMESADRSELIVLGSGCSTGVPSPLCLIRPTDPRCEVCHMAMKGPPELNRNYRYSYSVYAIRPSFIHLNHHTQGTQPFLTSLKCCTFWTSWTKRPAKTVEGFVSVLHHP